MSLPSTAIISDGPVGSATDYCGGIASVTIDVGSQAFATGEEKPFRQKLSLVNAKCTIEGIGFQVHTFVSAAHDVLVMELDDRRPQPEPIQVAVSMLRPPEVIAGDHIATTRFIDDPKRIALMQQFREREYYNASAVYVGLANGEPVAIEPSSERMRTLVIPAARGKRIVLITTAAGWKSEQDPSKDARNLFEQVSLQSADELRAAHQQH
jgi:hypothetical protein